VRRKIKRTYRVARYVIYKQTIVEPIDHLWTFVGAFLGIGLIGYFQDSRLAQQDNVFLIGSFGASAVLVFGATNSPLAQPRNLIFGHLICAAVGVSLHKLIPGDIWLASALAVSVSIVVMQVTKTMHPPGGATALIANIGSEKIKLLGYSYVISPVFSGAFILLVTALVVNNISSHRTYPARK
jgi:CBS domain-containing membrane protein